jgi:hypothetical protein
MGNSGVIHPPAGNQRFDSRADLPVCRSGRGRNAAGSSSYAKNSVAVGPFYPCFLEGNPEDSATENWVGQRIGVNRKINKNPKKTAILGLRSYTQKA